MNTTLVIARLLFSLVFAVAGIAKLTDREGSRRAVIDFGVPTTLATPLGILLPLVELAVAAALIPTSTALWGAIGALAFLLLFVAGISVNLARGRKPDCHCFGQLHSTPAGWKTLLRNGVLAVLAGLLVWQGWQGNVGPSAVGWIVGLSTVQLLGLAGGVVALGLLAAQWWFLLHLLRQSGRLMVRIEALESRLAAGAGAAPSPNGAVPAQPALGLSAGGQAPPFSLPDLCGGTVTLDSLRATGKTVVLIFTDPNCGPCTALLPEIGRWQREYAERYAISLISRGTPEENHAKSTEHGLTSVLLQDDWEVAQAYGVNGTPSAVVIRPDGAISPVLSGPEAIEGLFRPAYPVQPTAQGEPCPKCGKVHPNGNGSQAIPAGPKVGEPAPEIRLEDLEGRTVELADLKGSEILILFWNPGCGFCQRMLPDVKDLEADPPQGTPRMLFVSAGTEEANKAMGLSSSVVLDQSFSVGGSFGAGGTPSAVLVDKEGKVASEVAVGAPAVLELAGASQLQE